MSKQPSFKAIMLFRIFAVFLALCFFLGYRFLYVKFMPPLGTWQSLIGGICGIALLIFGLIWYRDAKRKGMLQTTEYEELFGYVGIFVIGATVMFSTVAFALYRFDLIYYSSYGIVNEAKLFDYFVWHLVDSIPSLEIWAAFEVDNPVIEQDIGAGLILLFFRLFVIIPLIILLRDWWKFRTVKAKTRQT